MHEQLQRPLLSPTTRGVHHLALCTDDIKRHNKFDVTRSHPGAEPSPYPIAKSRFPKVNPRVTTEDCAESLATRGGHSY